MIYSPLVKKACQILFEAHRADVDKGGYPYVFHPFYLATQMDDEESACTALLHDVLEDHGDRYTLSDFAKLGFSPAVIEALALLTHDPTVPYLDYVRKISLNSIARKVKIADLRHNMDARRLDGHRPPKMEYYEAALAILSSGKS